MVCETPRESAVSALMLSLVVSTSVMFLASSSRRGVPDPAGGADIGTSRAARGEAEEMGEASNRRPQHYRTRSTNPDATL